MVPNVSLRFLNRRANRQICRVCHELAELKTERLCAVCTHIKSQISLRFAEAVGGTISIPAEQQCKRSGCVRARRATGELLIFTRATYSILHEQTDGRSTSILDVTSCG